MYILYVHSGITMDTSLSLFVAQFLNLSFLLQSIAWKNTACPCVHAMCNINNSSVEDNVSNRYSTCSQVYNKKLN